jgi:hypothetical protein
MFVLASPVEAAAPRYILISGPGLTQPVRLANWNENHALLLALVGAPRAKASVVRGLGRRPRLDVALFWRWPERQPPTRPRRADQHGWFYPARASEPAVFDLLVNGIRVPRIAPVSTLRILARHGVPTRTSRPPSTAEQPTLCTASEVETLVRRFIDAFNGGDSLALDALFARDEFEWYSTDAPGERFTPLANDRASLVPYFATRHALGEQLTLRSFRFNGNSGGPPYGNFEYGLTRSADDLQPTPYHGKGAALCYRTRPDLIFVWSMSRE